MAASDVITFVSHTNKPGGGELALRRYWHPRSHGEVAAGAFGAWASAAGPSSELRSERHARTLGH